MKITVELDEGVKMTRCVDFTVERMMLEVERVRSMGYTGTADRFVEDLAAEAARDATSIMLQFISKHGLMVNRIKDGQAETLKVQDVNEALKFLREGDKKNVTEAAV